MGTSASTSADSVGSTTTDGTVSHEASNLETLADLSTPSLAMRDTRSRNVPDIVLRSPPPSDGYKWRKYGQKDVKGLKYPRSYYKCTYPGCMVKKYVEQDEQDGKLIERTSYKGEHSHDPSRFTRVNVTDSVSFKSDPAPAQQTLQPEPIVNTPTRTEDTISSQPDVSTPLANKNKHPWVIVESPGIRVIEHHTTTQEDNVSGTPVTYTTSRLVVEAGPEVDWVDDGYNWRKYGQKKVRGSPGPRNYYKCTEDGCPVKKYVERDQNKITTNYDGMHNHPLPEGVGRKKRSARKTKPKLSSDDSISNGDQLYKRIKLDNPTDESADGSQTLTASGQHERIPLTEIPLEYISQAAAEDQELSGLVTAEEVKVEPATDSQRATDSQQTDSEPR